MKNPEFIKLPILILCALLIYAGFKMLPRQEDIRTNAEKLALSSFLKEFHHAEILTEDRRLPEVTLLSRENREVELSRMAKGRISFVNFWATWCAPCLEELPSLARLQEANENILVLPISLDMQKSHEDLAKYFNKEELQDLRWFYDHKGILRKNLALKVYPTTYILDEDGKIIYILQGPVDWSSPKALDFAKVLSNKY